MSRLKHTHSLLSCDILVYYKGRWLERMRTLTGPSEYR